MDDKKIAFIFGSDKEEVGIYDGSIEKIGNIKDGTIHAACLVEYGREKYPEVGVFQKLNSRYMPQSVAYYFVKYFNHAVFLNTTKYLDDGRISACGKSGMLLLPDRLTENQKDTIEAFLDDVSDYSITISYNLHVEFGIVVGNELFPSSRADTKNTYYGYLEKEKGKSL